MSRTSQRPTQKRPDRRRRRKFRATLAVLASCSVLVASLSWPASADDQVEQSSQDDAGPRVIDTNTDSMTTLESDGSYSVEITGAPTHFLGQDGRWHDIDNTLIESSGTRFDAQNAANSYTAKVPLDASTDPVRFAIPAGHIDMAMRGLDGPPVTAGDEAIYGDVAKASSVTYAATSTGLKEKIDLQVAPSAPTSYTYDLSMSAGLTPELVDGSIVIKSAGEVVAIIPAGVMYDSAVEPHESDEINYALTPDDNGWTFTVTPSLDWLQDPSLTYPVTIDPTVMNANPSSDCFIGTGSPNAPHCGDTTAYVAVGLNPEVRRGLINFDFSSIPGNAVISAAQVDLYNDATKNTNKVTATYGLFNAAHKWGESATWNDSDREGAWSGGYEDPTPYSLLTLQGNTTGYKSFTGLAPLLQGWLTGETRPNGILLRQIGETTDHKLSFYSSSPTTPAGMLPKLTVNYTVPARNPVGCETTVDGDTYEEPSVDGLTDEEAQTVLENEMNTCFVYGTAETCETDPTIYVSQGCPTIDSDVNGRGTGTYADDEPQSTLNACEGCPGVAGAALWNGPINGPAIGNPSGGTATWVSMLAFGAAVAATTLVKTDIEWDDIKKRAKATKKIPWPDPNSATAQKWKDDDYKVYEIFAVRSPSHDYFRTFKYGITKQGSRDRHNAGKRRCNREFADHPKCEAKDIRENVQGFYNARREEAAFILRYFETYLKLPPGNQSGL